MRTECSIVFIMLLALTPNLSAKERNAAAIVDITKSPSTADWQYFFKSGSQLRQEFWEFHAKQNKQLKHWAWEWRVGWLRSCEDESAPYCKDVFAQGLKDKALVVRAEAASILGKVYAGTQDPAAIHMLVKSFEDDRNYRNGRPLIVHKRILFALKQIGGSLANKEAGRIAKHHETSEKYWLKIASKN